MVMAEDTMANGHGRRDQVNMKYTTGASESEGCKTANRIYTPEQS